MLKSSVFAMGDFFSALIPDGNAARVRDGSENHFSCAWKAEPKYCSGQPDGEA